MEWLAENWLWVIFGILFAGMHMFGHGGHGGHSGHDDSDKPSVNDPGQDKASPGKSSGHLH